jgi:hypothetical protein
MLDDPITTALPCYHTTTLPCVHATTFPRYYGGGGVGQCSHTTTGGGVTTPPRDLSTPGLGHVSLGHAPMVPPYHAPMLIPLLPRVHTVPCDVCATLPQGGGDHATTQP